MIKRRLIFALLYCDGYFVQSRNFRLQRVGDIRWLLNNYRFETIASAIDELAIINVSRKKIASDDFFDTARAISRYCFMPKMLGGHISNMDEAKRAFEAGADKVVINSAFFKSSHDVQKICEIYGSQAVVSSIDCKWVQEKNNFDVYIHHGAEKSCLSLRDSVKLSLGIGAGEILLQSIDNDGTAFGLDLRLANVFEELSVTSKVPLILAGGTGNFEHIKCAFGVRSVSAVLTANLLNFMGSSLPKTRSKLIEQGIDLPVFKG